jgi:general stress protein YciG
MTTESTRSTPSRTHLRGFASLSPERRSEIASKGGKHAHKLGVAHQFTSEEARIAGSKGGSARAAKRNGARA